jgi:hypothetical protein
MQGPAPVPPPCCAVTAIDVRGGVVVLAGDDGHLSPALFDFVKPGGGFEKKGYGVACYVLSATANINARAFAESYARAMRN